MAGHFIGIDFGTTNSAIGVVDERGERLLPLPGPKGEVETWRTVLFFDEEGKVVAGAPAIARYAEANGQGRLLQSFKSHLASVTFSKTHVNGRRWALEELIAVYLRQLREHSPIDLGHRCVVGRPVRYWGAESAADDSRAVERMQRALSLAGFTEAHFEFEPLGAAARYAATVAREEVIVVADFGGGTADFSVVRVAPGGVYANEREKAEAVLATGGLGVSGDAFDARIIDEVVAPLMGKGTSYDVGFGSDTLIPAWLFHKLRRWHHIPLLGEAATLRLIAQIEHGAQDPVKFERFLRLVRDDLGLWLHQAVERAKIAMSRHGEGRLTVGAGIDLDERIDARAFDQWIAPDLAAIGAVLDEVILQAGMTPSQIDRVFTTGGTSMVPAVRRELEGRFGKEKLVGGDELVTVALGLARRAQAIF